MTENTNLTIQMVREFIKAFDMEDRTPEFWAGLIHEEITELEEVLAHMMKELCDVAYVTAGYISSLGEDPEVHEEHFGLINKATGLLVAGREVFGEQRLSEAFRRVHESNMSKLGDDGKPVYRWDGKVIKGPNYKAPDLTDLVA